MEAPKFIYISSKKLRKKTEKRFAQIKPYVTSVRSDHNVFVLSSKKLDESLQGVIYLDESDESIKQAINFITRYLELLSNNSAQDTYNQMLKEFS